MGGMGNQLLRAAEQLGSVTPASLARWLVITEEWAKRLCLGLVEDGHLAQVGEEDRYEITPKGKNALDPYRYRGGIGRVPISNYP